MNRSSILSPFWEQALKDQKIIDFYPTPSDSTHFIVSRILEEGREKIGHVYVEYYGDEFRYISTNKKGKEIFQPTTDFNLVEVQFERYAHLIALQQKVRENNKQNIIHAYSLNLKNTNTMKNQTQNTTEKTQKQNQLRFIEYEKPAGDGHFITIGDSYHNVIGRVHKSFNEETKKYEYVAFDHAGNLMSKSDKLWEVKNEFVKNRETLLEQAHQRRIAAKEKSKEVQTDKTEERKNEIGKLREGKSGIEKQNEKSVEKSDTNSSRENSNVVDDEWNQLNERAQELDDIRNEKEDDRADMDMER